MKIEKREEFQKKLYTGFFTGRVIAVNPTKEELSEILGFELEKEQNYVQTINGQENVIISFWMEADHPDKPKFNTQIYIADKEVYSESSGKTQFVNQCGNYSWVKSEENLLSWFRNFTNKQGEIVDTCEVRKAIQGEANLYNFLRSWYGQANFKSKNTNVFINVQELFLNPAKYIQREYGSRIKLEQQYLAETDSDVREDLNKDIITTTVTGLATVRIREKDNEVKKYQSVYTDFLPNYLVKKLRLAVTNNLWDLNKGADKALAKYHEQLIGQHGSKDAYQIQMLGLFDDKKHGQLSNETMISSDEPKTEIDF